MAATVWAWMAMPCAHSAASSWAMPTAPSTAALCCLARCRATRRLQGTPQARSQARATSLSGATLLLELAWSAGILPRWADSTSLLGLHPVRRKKASKRNRQSTAGDVYVVGGYREEGWDPANPGLSMPFVPLAALLFLLGDVFEGYQQQDDPASVPLLTPHAGGGINPSPAGACWGLRSSRLGLALVCLATWMKSPRVGWPG